MSARNDDATRIVGLTATGRATITALKMNRQQLIDVRRKWIVHLPEVATDPGYVGSRQIRPYRFEGGRMILSDIEKNDPSVARWEIVWEKAR